MTANWAADLAAALDATLVSNYGDARIVLDDRVVIYCNASGVVKLDHRGHVIPLGPCSAPTATLVAAYRDATRPVRDADMAALRAGGVG